MREIIPEKLWIGNAFDARDVTAVLNLGVAALVDLAMEEPPVKYPRDIAYCRLPLVDGDGNSPAVLSAAIECTATFVAQGIPTLVFCGGGMSRSPAIAAAALSRVEGISLEEAMKQAAISGPHDVSTSLWDDVCHCAVH